MMLCSFNNAMVIQVPSDFLEKHKSNLHIITIQQSPEAHLAIWDFGRSRAHPFLATGCEATGCLRTDPMPW